MRMPQATLAIDPQAVQLGEHWRETGMFRRMMVRMLAPDVARDAAAIARTGGYVEAPRQQRPAGPVTRLVDRHMS